MDAKIYAVIDTNVLVSALFSISGNSNPSIIIRKIIDGVITPLSNEDILAEYEEVLNRDKFPFRKADIDWLISAFLDYGISLGRTAISDEIFIDKDDIVFYEVALSKEDSFLVTAREFWLCRAFIDRFIFPFQFLEYDIEDDIWFCNAC